MRASSFLNPPQGKRAFNNYRTSFSAAQDRRRCLFDVVVRPGILIPFSIQRIGKVAQRFGKTVFDEADARPEFEQIFRCFVSRFRPYDAALRLRFPVAGNKSVPQARARSPIAKPKV